MHAINDGHVHRLITKPWDGPRLRRELRELILGGEAGEPAREALAQEEGSLLDDLAPMQDAESGAFIVEDPKDT